jgi:dTDP-4-amino-4,6-dideoxygalactose transaminase
MTSGEGGAVVAKDAAVLERIRTFRSQGMVRDPALLRYPDEGPWHQEVHSIGLNYRLPDVLCALGQSQLARLDLFKAKRAAIHARYNRELGGIDGLTLPIARAGVDPMWHLYPIRVPAPERKRIFTELRAAGVLVQVNYLPVYWHPVFEDLGYRRGMCPVAETYYQEEISLPMYADLSEHDQDRVIEELQRALRV